jgi:hypothetical protein
VTKNTKQALEDWVIDACTPFIKNNCRKPIDNSGKTKDLCKSETTQPNDDQLICQAEAKGILLDPDRFPKASLIAIEYLYNTGVLLISTPKLKVENQKEEDDLYLYSEPLIWLPQARWRSVTIKDKIVSSGEMLENFWTLKDNKGTNSYSQWLMMAGGISVHTYNGGTDIMVNWSPDETPITWKEAFEKFVTDCDLVDNFTMVYSLQDELEGKGAFTMYQLNVYSCEPKKD